MTATEAEDPELALQLLSVSDSAARANMMRHTVALRFLLTGKLRDEDCPGTMFGANFGSDPNSVAKLKALTQIDGSDRVMIGFDVDNPAGSPENYGLWHCRDGVSTFYDRCAPWVPTGAGRALLVAMNDTDVAHFSSRPDRPLLRRAGRPAPDVMPGVVRARTRLARLVATPAVRGAVGDMYMRVASRVSGETLFKISSEAA